MHGYNFCAGRGPGELQCAAHRAHHEGLGEQRVSSPYSFASNGILGMLLQNLGPATKPGPHISLL